MIPPPVTDLCSTLSPLTCWHPAKYLLV